MPHSTLTIEFVLTGVVEGMHFDPLRPDGIEFNVTDPVPLRFTLKPEKANGNDYAASRSLECKVYAAWPASESQRAFVQAYNCHNRMTGVAEGLSLPYEKSGRILIADDRSFEKGFRPRRKHCPVEIRELLTCAESELSKFMDRFLKLIRWRQGIDAPGEVIRIRSLYWRVDDGVFPIAPLSDDGMSEVEIPAMFGIHWEEEDLSDLAKLWEQKNLMEPLGHALVREAGALSKDSPRSSILIMTAALETAVKIHISRVAPDTAWLMEEVPSPPIFKVLRDYIPLIHSNRGVNIDYWQKLRPWFKKVQKLIEVRNKVAHTGTIPADAPPIRDSLEMVTDLLYLLDVLDGHDWAKSQVGYAMRNELGWPSPKHGRWSIKVSVGY